MARLLLHPHIPNIQTSWVKLGAEGAAEMLRSGANDLGGTLMEETISRMAGSSYGSYRSVRDLTAIAEAAGRPARPRTTLYGEVPGGSGRRRRWPRTGICRSCSRCWGTTRNRRFGPTWAARYSYKCCGAVDGGADRTATVHA
ncbi:hypothetical protein GCM10020000_46760 [Streptomyces olivoverticillatus]